MNVELQEYRPVQALRPHVQRFWAGRFNAGGADCLSQRVVPSGFVEVIIHLTDLHCDLPVSAEWRQSPDYTLIGLQNEPYEVRFSSEVEVFAIRFKPAGFYSLFGVPLGEIVDTHEDLVAVLGAHFRAFAAHLRDEPTVAARLHTAERYLSRAAESRDVTYLNRAEELIRTSGGNLRVEDVADRLCISRRQLERAFKSKLGLSPKQYMRIARLNRAQRLLQEGRCQGLADVAYRAGYADQSHLNRDFRLLVGDSPSHYLAKQQYYAVNAPDIDPSPEDFPFRKASAA